MVVEYVLLLLVAVGIAFAIRTMLVKTGDSAADSGAVVKQWDKMECAIACDDPNSHSGAACSQNNCHP